MATKIISRDRIAGIILAGGRSSRFEGGAKERALLNGRPIIEYVIERAKPQVGTLALSRPHGEAGSAYNLQIIADKHEDCGPMAGLSAGLAWARANQPPAGFLAAFACDTPNFPSNIIERLAEPLAAGNTRAAIAASRGALHPTFGLWSVDLARDAEAAIERGALSLKKFAQSIGAAFVNFGADDAFFNINRREDLERLQAQRSNKSI